MQSSSLQQHVTVSIIILDYGYNDEAAWQQAQNTSDVTNESITTIRSHCHVFSVKLSSIRQRHLVPNRQFSSQAKSDNTDPTCAAVTVIHNNDNNNMKPPHLCPLKS